MESIQCDMILCKFVLKYGAYGIHYGLLVTEQSIRLKHNWFLVDIVERNQFVGSHQMSHLGWTGPRNPLKIKPTLLDSEFRPEL